ncbi:MAG TPA: 23S rRNA (pseudouridine(1915)-N(3))-methyltransferase RlmH [Candidatus Limnocylindrales bacterium]|nr:23S rRNA (pseudouridine(1915)-N(3))-methyltransferase RlmH [Candidatus Limnocylindrales bacterium]
MKIRLVLLGKTRRAECRVMLEDYVARIRRYTEVEVAEVREDSAALQRLKFSPGAGVVLLDAAGKQHASADFAKWLGRERDRGVREIAFLCGGAEGFPEALRKQATNRISLSTLTMPHELARVVLAEQIYRGFAILAGHPYPK